jgi:hypothetical protein
VQTELEDELWSILETEVLDGELGAPLPTKLHAAQRRGIADYEGVEEFENLKVYATRQLQNPGVAEPQAMPD